MPLRPDSWSCRPSWCPLVAARDFPCEQHQAWPSLFLVIDTKAAKNFTVTSSTMMTFLGHVPLYTNVHTFLCACINRRIMCSMGFPYFSGKESAYQCRRHKRCGFKPWVRKIPWGRKWQPTPVLLPGESHGQRSLAGYSPWGPSESDTTKQLTHTPTHVTAIT